MSGGAPQEVAVGVDAAVRKTDGHKIKYSFAVITALRQRLGRGEKADMVLFADIGGSIRMSMPEKCAPTSAPRSAASA